MRARYFQSLFNQAGKLAVLPNDASGLEQAGAVLRASGRRLLGRSLAIREVDAGSCNGCELEIRALNNAVYDAEHFGVRFVVSPRHADVLLVTGPVTRAMTSVLLEAHATMREPKWVVAAGDCAAGCGVFTGGAVLGSLDRLLPVDLTIAGCPPRPIDLLAGLASLLRLPPRRRSAANASSGTGPAS